MMTATEAEKTSEVDPSLLTQEAVGHKNPEETSGKKYGLDASGAGGSRACSRRQAFCPGWKGEQQERTLLYCVTGSPGEPWAGKQGEAEPGCVGAGCALR